MTLPPQSRLTLAPIHFDPAKAFIREHHRHSVPPLSARYAAAAAVDGLLVAVVMAGRPTARGLQDGWTQEVLRVCSTGHRNACSFLYGAAWKALKAMGYLRAVTYTRDDEDAASVRACGWVRAGEVRGRSWDTPSRPRQDKDERVDRVRWEIHRSAWAPDLMHPLWRPVETSQPVPQLELGSAA